MQTGEKLSQGPVPGGRGDAGLLSFQLAPGYLWDVLSGWILDCSAALSSTSPFFEKEGHLPWRSKLQNKYISIDNSLTVSSTHPYREPE